jgi:hypothetical protein
MDRTESGSVGPARDASLFNRSIARERIGDWRARWLRTKRRRTGGKRYPRCSVVLLPSSPRSPRLSSDSPRTICCPGSTVGPRHRLPSPLLPLPLRPSRPTLIDLPVGVPNCNAPQTQLCTPVAVVNVDTPSGFLDVDFTAAPTHCSDLFAHIFLDGVELGAPGYRRVRPARACPLTRYQDHTASVCRPRASREAAT